MKLFKWFRFLLVIIMHNVTRKFHCIQKGNKKLEYKGFLYNKIAGLCWACRSLNRSPLQCQSLAPFLSLVIQHEHLLVALSHWLRNCFALLCLQPLHFWHYQSLLIMIISYLYIRHFNSQMHYFLSHIFANNYWNDYLNEVKTYCHVI